jgi:hypothetical protein
VAGNVLRDLRLKLSKMRECDLGRIPGPKKRKKANASQTNNPPGQSHSSPSIHKQPPGSEPLRAIPLLALRSGSRRLRRDVHSFQLRRNALHGFLIQPIVLFLRRFSRTRVTSFMLTCSACVLEVFEHGLTRVARPSDMDPDRLKLSPGPRRRSLRLARIGLFHVFGEFGPVIR